MHFSKWLNENSGIERAYYNTGLKLGDPINDEETAKTLAQHLVFAYEEAENDIERNAIIKEMQRIPTLTMLGNVNEIVPFSGAWMITKQSVWPGESVQVDKSGFRITINNGSFLLGKMLVSSTTKAITSDKFTTTLIGPKDYPKLQNPEKELLQRKINDMEAKLKIAKSKSEKETRLRIITQYKNDLSKL